MFQEIKMRVASEGLAELFEISALRAWDITYERDGARMTAIIESPAGKRFRVYADGQIDRA